MCGWLMILGARPGWAGDAAPTFVKRIRPASLMPSGEQYPLAMKVLSDGNVRVVARDGASIVSMLYSPSGVQLSVVTIRGVLSDIVALDSKGDVFAVGEATNAWPMKYDGSTGRPAWTAPSFVYAIGDGPSSLAVDGGGNLIVVTEKSVGPDWYDRFSSLWKIDGDSGQPLWGPVVTSWGSIITSVQGASDGNVFAIELHWSSSTQQGTVEATRFSSTDGHIIWKSQVSDQWSSYLLELHPSGDPVIVGNGVTIRLDRESGSEIWSTHAGDGFGARAMDGAGNVFTGYGQLSKIDGETGSILWQWTGTSGSWVCAVDGAGNPLVGGAVEDPTRWTMTKLDGCTGAPLWGPVQTNPIDGGAWWSPVMIAMLSDGEVIVGGYRGYPVGDLAIAGFDGLTGALAFQPVVYRGGIGRFDQPIAAEIAPGGDVVALVSGLNQSLDDGDYLVRLDSTGTVVWGPRWVAPMSHWGATVMHLDSSGNVFVAATGPRPGYDMRIWKFSSSNGDILWGPRTIPSAPGQVNDPTGVTVDDAGDVILTGGVDTNPWNGRSIAVKYDGEDGTIIWGPIDLPSWFFPADALRREGSNASMLVGHVWTSSSGWNASLLSLDGSNGSILWGPTDLGKRELWGNADQFDSSGDLVIAGYLYSTDYSSNRNWIAKIRVSDGQAIWGPIEIESDVTCWVQLPNLALDSTGNALVSRGLSCPGNGGSTTWETFKVDGSTGALLWGPLGDGRPLEKEGFPASIAVGADGEILESGTVSEGNRYEWEVIARDAATGAVLQSHDVAATFAGAYGWLVRPSGNAFWAFGTSGIDFVAAKFEPVLAIEESSEFLAPAVCGSAWNESLTSRNASSPVTWKIVSGSLPPGLAINSATGVLGGIVSGAGSFSFRVRLTDSSAASADREFRMDVFDGRVELAATQDRIWRGDATTLAAPTGFASYLWSTGESTREIEVSPVNATLFSVRVVDASGCTSVGARRIEVRSDPPPTEGSNDGPACDGSSLHLSAALIPGAAYEWFGPNGFSSIDREPTIEPVTPLAAGSYRVRIGVGGCWSSFASTTVEVHTAPTEARDLLLVRGASTTLSWSPPANTGGGVARYDLLRSDDPASWDDATCVASDLSATSTTDDSADGPTFFFLIRAETDCGGNLGTDSNGIARTAISCP